MHVALSFFFFFFRSPPARASLCLAPSHAQSTLSILPPPSRKQGSITFLTSAAIFHLDTCAIQLAALALLACPPPTLLPPTRP